MRYCTYSVNEQEATESFSLANSVFECGLNASAIATYLAVTKLTAGADREFPLQREIMALTGLSRKTTVVSLQSLENAGILTYIHCGKEATA